MSTEGKKEKGFFTKLYLLGYNLANAVGWGIVLFQTANKALVEKVPPQQGYGTFGKTLCIAQGLAGLEVLHSLTGLVPSPVSSTFLQVFSRYAVLYAFTNMFPQAQAHWSMYLMVGSWALVEVPRYLFYAVNLFSEQVPYPLFWLRYSLFAVLYPSGISGEIMQILTCMPVLLQHNKVAAWYLTCVLLFMYLPGSPFMFLHMVSQRAKSFKARLEKGAPPKPALGVEFPLDTKTNQRSTTYVTQNAVAAAIGAVDKEAGAAALGEKKWFATYNKHIVKSVELQCHSNENCLKIAQAGLDYLHNTMVYAQEGDEPTKSISMKEAMKKFGNLDFVDSFEYVGEKKRDPKFEFNMPYKKFRASTGEEKLSGDALRAQLDKWVERGTIEKDARDAIMNVAVLHPEYHGDALKDKWFVLLGASSAMGPLRVLLELGANIIAIDLDRPQIWERILGWAKNSSSHVLFPLKKKRSEISDTNDIKQLAAHAGANLFTDAPRIANWVSQQKKGKQLVIGGYAYLDGGLFVKLAVAMDAIMEKVMETRKDTALAFLCSPTDVFVTDDECRDAQISAAKKVPWWQGLISSVSGSMLKRNVMKQAESATGEKFSIVDGLSLAQSSNYAVAKRLQHWRCMLAREAGHTVSTNIAPSTATASVVHNPQFAAAYVGMSHFSPMEVVYENVSNSIMTALMLNDICNPTSAAQPKTHLGNHIRLFSKTSCHFGIWRMAYKIGSIGEISALIGYSKMYSSYLYILVVAMAVFGEAIRRKGAPHQWFK